MSEELPGKKPLSSAPSQDSDESHNEDDASYGDAANFSQPGSDRDQDEGDEDEGDEDEVALNAEAKTMFSNAFAVIQKAELLLDRKKFGKFMMRHIPAMKELIYHGNDFQVERIQKSRIWLRGSKKKESDTPDDDDSDSETTEKKVFR